MIVHILVYALLAAALIAAKPKKVSLLQSRMSDVRVACSVWRLPLG